MTNHNLRATRAGTMPGGCARRAAFPSEIRGQRITKDGREFYQLDGYATVYNRGYPMWDAAGQYTEIAASGMLTRSLAMSPDVAFLTNHSGVTQARTTNGSLTLTSDSHGLRAQALLNPNRVDVSDLISAIDDKLVTEMSFAFMIDDGSWDEDFTTYTLNQVDINRGDVSAVNYGANPYTSIGAMSQEYMRMSAVMPESIRAIASRLGRLEDIPSSSVAAMHERLRQMDNETVMGVAERIKNL